MCLKKMLYSILPGRHFLFNFLIMAMAVAINPATFVFADGNIEDYSALPPFISWGVTPNVLIILDNSNSMDEDVDGNAVGSDAANSRSEIARQAVLALIEANKTKMNLGLMAYQQTAVARREIHYAAYYCSYDPNTYYPEGTPTPKDPSTNTMRCPNPTDPGNYIYFDMALPFYANTSQGTSFLYSSDFTEDGVSTNDHYWSYRDKTGVLNPDPPSGATQANLTGTYGYDNYHANYTLVPTDEDIAAGFTEFGEQMFWHHVGPTWFSNSSPGLGYLHVPITDSTPAHITSLEEKLGTSNFSTTAGDHPNSDLDIPLRNAGLTPLGGALESARKYFQGTLTVNEGGPQPTPCQQWCQKQFVVLVTDGLPSVNRNGTAGDADSLLPAVVDEVTLLRSTTVSGFGSPFDIETFVLGFAIPPQLGSKLDAIAVAGGTDVNGHAYLAGNANELAAALRSIFLEILNRVSSGSAASVISNSRSGEGAVYQSIFFPEYRDPMGNSVNWTGDSHALFVDTRGNLREDTDGDATLKLDTDRFVVFNEETGKVKLYEPVDAEGKELIEPNEAYRITAGGDVNNEFYIMSLKYVWSAFDWLSDPSMDVLTQRAYGSNDKKRYIFTDKIDTGSPVNMSNVDNTDVMEFTPGFADDTVNKNYYFLNPYMTYDHDGDPGTPEVGLTEPEMITEAQNIIKFIRGQEGLLESGTGTTYRSRTLDMDGDGTNDTVFRLGDIVHSTPTVVSGTSEDFDLLYGDASYQVFKKKYQKRRSVIYVSANDGMLHAFNGGFYDAGEKKFCKQPYVWNESTSAWEPAIWDLANSAWKVDPDTNDTNYKYELGAELWAYIPNAMLPHLRWLKEQLRDDAHDTYFHVYYVDLKSRIFDARIFFEADGETPIDDDHPNGWGTVLLGGMRLGGAPIGVDTNGNGDTTDANDLNFRSTYFALDITNPEVPPGLIWSYSHPNLGFTTSYPTPIRVGSKWFIVFGSGPVDYEAMRKDDGVNITEYGGSNRTPSLYIINARDGTLAREIAMDGHSFLGDPIAVDFDGYTGEPYVDLNNNGRCDSGEPYTDKNSNGLYDSWGIEEYSGEAIYIASDGCGA